MEMTLLNQTVSAGKSYNQNLIWVAAVVVLAGNKRQVFPHYCESVDWKGYLPLSKKTKRLISV